MIHGEYNICVNAFDINIRTDYMDVNTRLRLNEKDAVQLLQVLWDLGLRPAGREAEMAAMKLHLQDMRRLVFDGPNQC